MAQKQVLALVKIQIPAGQASPEGGKITKWFLESRNSWWRSYFLVSKVYKLKWQLNFARFQ